MSASPPHPTPPIPARSPSSLPHRPCLCPSPGWVPSPFRGPKTQIASPWFGLDIQHFKRPPALQNNTLAVESAPLTLTQSTLSLGSHNWLTFNDSMVALDSSRLNFTNYFTWWVVGGWCVFDKRATIWPAGCLASLWNQAPPAAAASSHVGQGFHMALARLKCPFALMARAGCTHGTPSHPACAPASLGARDLQPQHAARRRPAHAPLHCTAPQDGAVERAVRQLLGHRAEGHAHPLCQQLRQRRKLHMVRGDTVPCRAGDGVMPRCKAGCRPGGGGAWRGVRRGGGGRVCVVQG